MNSASTESSPRKVTAIAAEQERPDVWSALGVVALYVLLQAGLSLPFRRIVEWTWWLKMAARFGGQDAEATVHVARGNASVEVLLTAVTITVAATIIVVLVQRLWPMQWSRAALPGFGFVQPKDKSSYLSAALFGVATPFLGGLIAGLLMLVDGRDIHQGVSTLLTTPPAVMRALMTVLVVGVVPFVEELLFRGVLLSGLARRMRVRWAVIATAVIFACLHLSDFHFAWYPVPLFIVVGITLGWLRVQTGSLWPPIAMHATFNGITALTSMVIIRSP